MTQEYKELLSREFSARLPNGLKGTVEIEVSTGEYSIESGHLLFIEKEIDVELLGINKDTEEIEVCPLNDNIDISEYDYTIGDFIPYLRPMSSMTEKEKEELRYLTEEFSHTWIKAKTPEERQKITSKYHYDCCQFYYAHHLDCAGLIEKGLALVALEGMYK